MLGFKSFHVMRRTLVGIELVHMLCKGQMDDRVGAGLTTAEQFYIIPQMVALHQTVERCSCKANGGPDILLVAMFPRTARRSVMDPTTVFCPHEHCHARGQTGQGNIGIHAHQEQRFICHECHKTFSARKGTVFSRLRPSAGTVVLVVTLLAHGCPLQAIVAALGFDERTGADWWARSGRQGQAVHEYLVEQPRDLGQVQADELRVKQQGGIVWMALAMK